MDGEKESGRILTLPRSAAPELRFLLQAGGGAGSGMGDPPETRSYVCVDD